jgi:hypothetical protein
MGWALATEARCTHGVVLWSKRPSHYQEVRDPVSVHRRGGSIAVATPNVVTMFQSREVCTFASGGELGTLGSKA